MQKVLGKILVAYNPTYVRSCALTPTACLPCFVCAWPCAFFRNHHDVVSGQHIGYRGHQAWHHQVVTSRHDCGATLGVRTCQPRLLAELPQPTLSIASKSASLPMNRLWHAETATPLTFASNMLSGHVSGCTFPLPHPVSCHVPPWHSGFWISGHVSGCTLQDFGCKRSWVFV